MPVADPKPTVFVVDDNPSIRRSLQALAEAAGLAVRRLPRPTSSWPPMTGRGPAVSCWTSASGGSGLDLRTSCAGEGDSADHRPHRIRRRPHVGARVKSGAVDFLQKPVPPKDLLELIREAIGRDRVEREAAAKRAAIAGRIAQLTPREREVMELVAAGKTSRESAASLGISARTVEGYRRTVFWKMAVGSATGLARALGRFDTP
jgi:FixJ family two-component response regulator